MKKGLLYSAFILSIGSILAKFVGVFLKVPLVNIVGDYGMGLYQLPYPMYTMVLTFSMTGFSLAVSRMISFYESQHEHYIVSKIFKISLILITILSFALTIIYVFLGNTIITIFKWPPDSYLPYISLAPAIFLVSVQSIFRGFFNGLKEMDKTAISQIIESLLRVVAGLFLCEFFLHYSLGYAVAGALMGASIGGLFSLIYLIMMYKNHIKSNIKSINSSFRRKIEQNFKIAKELIINTVNFSLSSILISLISIVDSFLYPYFMNIKNHSYKETSELFGIFSGKVMTLIHVPLTFSVSMAITLIPYISSTSMMREREQIIKQSFEYLFLINVPAVLAFLFFSDEVMQLVFFNNSSGSELLKITSFIALIISAVQLTTSILQGLNKFSVPIKNILISIVLKILFLFIFIIIYDLNIKGCILANVLCYLIICILNLIELRVEGYKIMNIQKFIYITLASVIMIITGVIVKSYIHFKIFWLKDLFLILSCMFIYFILLTILGIVKINKIKNIVLR